ncbi:MAG: hypothetical protein M3Z92_12305 [Bacteroidota bacterium]|nr:hypothetical protein [Bacteroidota bacterium]
MKKLYLFTMGFIISASVLISCKKDKETTAQKVQHNWTIVSQIDNSHDDSGDYRDTTLSVNGSGDFIKFNSDGTFNIQFEGTTDTGNYSIISDTQMSINGQTATILTLTSSQFVIYSKEGSATEYDESTFNLKR